MFGASTGNFLQTVIITENSPKTQNQNLMGCMSVQLSDLVEPSFWYKRSFRSSVKEPLTMKNKYSKKTRKADMSRENRVHIIQNCSESLVICLLEFFESSNKHVVKR